jgi:acetyl-CoA carboxylase carboxyl transferase subunit beta
MNWISKFIKPKIKSLFKKKSSGDNKTALWTNCECKNLIYKDELFNNLSVCPKCNFHHRLTCEERFKIFFDNKEYTILETPMPRDNPLQFPNYEEKLKKAREKTKQPDAVLIADGKLDGMHVTVGAQNFNFIGGAIGAASGEAFIHGVQHAINNKTGFIFFSASGGQKMQEGAIALMQMARTVLAINEFKKHNLPYIVVMTNPTTGGASASFAGLGDVAIAEPGATVAFAGARVIKDTVKEELPVNFQKSEWILDHGGLDLILERKYLRGTIAKLLQILLKKKESEAISSPDVKSFEEDLQPARKKQII